MLCTTRMAQTSSKNQKLVQKYSQPQTAKSTQEPTKATLAAQQTTHEARSFCGQKTNSRKIKQHKAASRKLDTETEAGTKSRKARTTKQRAASPGQRQEAEVKKKEGTTQKSESKNRKGEASSKQEAKRKSKIQKAKTTEKTKGDQKKNSKEQKLIKQRTEVGIRKQKQKTESKSRNKGKQRATKTERIKLRTKARFRKQKVDSTKEESTKQKHKAKSKTVQAESGEQYVKTTQTECRWDLQNRPQNCKNQKIINWSREVNEVHEHFYCKA